MLLNYAIRLLVTVRCRKTAEDARGRDLSPVSWRWLLTPACLLLMLTVWMTDWPLHARFAASRGALERVVQLYSPAGGVGNVSTPRWIGLYHVRAMEYAASGTVYFVVDSIWVDPVFIVYCPSGVPPPTGRRISLSSQWNLVI
jgi:hypothetical protein